MASFLASVVVYFSWRLQVFPYDTFLQVAGIFSASGICSSCVNGPLPVNLFKKTHCRLVFLFSSILWRGTNLLFAFYVQPRAKTNAKKTIWQPSWVAFLLRDLSDQAVSISFKTTVTNKTVHCWWLFNLCLLMVASQDLWIGWIIDPWGLICDSIEEKILFGGPTHVMKSQQEEKCEQTVLKRKNERVAALIARKKVLKRSKSH